MKIETMSVVVAGNNDNSIMACDADCPYCVAKMTGCNCPRVDLFRQDRAIGICLDMSFRNHVSTMLLTGKGEPCLQPQRISSILSYNREHRYSMPFIELQTNGIQIQRNADQWFDGYLEEWFYKRLTTMCVSVVHYDSAKNAELVKPKSGAPVDLPELIRVLHEARFTVRLCCIMVDGYIDSLSGVLDLVEFARRRNVEQVTVRPVTAPSECVDMVAKEWVEQNSLKPNGKAVMSGIHDALETQAVALLDIPEVGRVYDLHGQNLCVATCLTPPKNDQIRQLIVMPDGTIRYDWQYQGAILPS